MGGDSAYNFAETFNLLSAFQETVVVGESGDDYIKYSDYIPLPQGGVRSLYSKLTSVLGTPNCKIEAELSCDGGDSYATGEPITIESGANDELLHQNAFSVNVCTGFRLKVTGLSGNANDTVIAEMKLCVAR